MQTPEWLKPAICGAGVGAIALTIAGFGWGGWVTAPKADVMASDRANEEVVSVLLPICLSKSEADPQAVGKLAELKNASSYNRTDILVETGWATMPGSSEPNRIVAKACADKLSL